AGDTNFHSDVFVKDTLTGQTVRASVDSGGTEGDTYSLQPSITADGHYVVFYSLASNLVTGDTNGLIDVFRAENPEFSPDTDGDGLRDDVDAFPNDPTETVDFDGDGIGNNADPDDDNDGMPDSFEITHGLDLLDPSDASADADGDGYDNESEFRAGTDPNNNGESPGTVAALHYKILANDGEIADYYGSSVAIDGDTALIGSRGDDGNGADSGSAYVYLRDSAGNWNLQQKLTAGDGAAAYDYFGLSVSLSGDTALIGAYGTSDIGTNSGAAYVFTRLGSIWSEQDKLTATIAAAYDNFGQSVVIDGDTALIGASGDDTKESDAGAAYVFTRTGSNWSEQAKLTAGDGAANDYLGNSVSLSGDTALIGAAEDDHSVTNSGSAYVFTRSGLLWSEQAKLTANDAAANDYFGNSVSLSGDTALIGAEEDDDNGNGSGSVYVFTRNGINWSEQAKLLPGDGAADQYFGYEVTVDGSLALVGAPGDAADKGATYIFTADAQGNWTEYQKLAANDGTDSGQSWGGEGSPGDQFGIAVARSGDRVLVGASLDDDNGADAGSAYLFELDLPPVANNDTDTLLEGGSKVIYLAANDTDANGDLDPASIVITSQPANRATDVVVNAGGTVYYTHDGSETTSDSFTYTIADLNGNVSLEGTVELTITSANDAPALDLDGTVAGVNFATTFTEGAGGVAVVDSDASLDDPDSGDQVENAFLSIGSPTAEDVLYVQGGQAALDLINSNITWVGAETPDQPFVALSGAATPAEYLAAIQLVRYDNSSSQPNIPPSRLVSITVDDGEVSSPVAAAVITINAVNSDFTAADDSYIVDEDTINNALNVTSNDIDPDGTEPVISLIVTPPANGTAVPSGDGHSIFYTPAENFSGVDTIVYEASDGGFTHQATVTITVNNQNDRPVLDLDGVAGGSTGYATAFTEGSGAVA
ncbi:MAG: tandem-95 repeat protein, partial [Gammaproteobacteria bacterium]|nr:tandem-95 repeat protein [Gammaproteobacteria bacterium]